jgi:hypothetical protein
MSNRLTALEVSLRRSVGAASVIMALWVAGGFAATTRGNSHITGVSGRHRPAIPPAEPAAGRGCGARCRNPRWGRASRATAPRWTRRPPGGTGHSAPLPKARHGPRLARLDSAFGTALPAGAGLRSGATLPPRRRRRCDTSPPFGHLSNRPFLQVADTPARVGAETRLRPGHIVNLRHPDARLVTRQVTDVSSFF